MHRPRIVPIMLLKAISWADRHRAQVVDCPGPVAEGTPVGYNGRDRSSMLSKGASDLGATLPTHKQAISLEHMPDTGGTSLSQLKSHPSTRLLGTFFSGPDLPGGRSPKFSWGGSLELPTSGMSLSKKQASPCDRSVFIFLGGGNYAGTSPHGK